MNLVDYRIERVPLDGGKPEILPGTAIPGSFPDGTDEMGISLDGRWLAWFVTMANGSVHKIGVVPIDAGSKSAARLFDPNPHISDGPRFTPDGKNIVYPIRENGVDNLWLQPVDGSSGHEITNFKSDGIRGFDWSPDGKALGVLRARSESDIVLLRDAGPSSR